MPPLRGGRLNILDILLNRRRSPPGFPAVGILQFVAPDEREQRVAALREAGVAAVVASWRQLGELLGVTVARP